MSKSTFPQHIIDRYGNQRLFKGSKRFQIKRVQKALASLRTGCAYMPRGVMRKLQAVDLLMAEVQELSSAKAWGR